MSARYGIQASERAASAVSGTTVEMSSRAAAERGEARLSTDATAEKGATVSVLAVQGMLGCALYDPGSSTVYIVEDMPQPTEEEDCIEYCCYSSIQKPELTSVDAGEPHSIACGSGHLGHGRIDDAHAISTCASDAHSPDDGRVSLV